VDGAGARGSFALGLALNQSHRLLELALEDRVDVELAADRLQPDLLPLARFGQDPTVAKRVPGRVPPPFRVPREVSSTSSLCPGPSAAVAFGATPLCSLAKPGDFSPHPRLSRRGRRVPLSPFAASMEYAMRRGRGANAVAVADLVDALRAWYAVSCGPLPQPPCVDCGRGCGEGGLMIPTSRL
jgi:hypothetical protein